MCAVFVLSLNEVLCDCSLYRSDVSLHGFPASSTYRQLFIVVSSNVVLLLENANYSISHQGGGSKLAGY